MCKFPEKIKFPAEREDQTYKIHRERALPIEFLSGNRIWLQVSAVEV